MSSFYESQQPEHPVGLFISICPEGILNHTNSKTKTTQSGVAGILLDACMHLMVVVSLFGSPTFVEMVSVFMHWVKFFMWVLPSFVEGVAI